MFTKRASPSRAKAPKFRVAGVIPRKATERAKNELLSHIVRNLAERKTP